MTSVTRNDAERRYELRVDGELAAVAEFIAGDAAVVFTHTQTLPGFEGRGLGLELAKGAVADAVTRQELITPLCPFMRRYLETHEVPGARVHFPDER